MAQKPSRKELFFHEDIGTASVVWYPELPDRLFLIADYYLNLSTTANMRVALGIAETIFEGLRAHNVEEVYCTAHSQSAYNFNIMLGFERTNESNEEYQFEIMKKVL